MRSGSEEVGEELAQLGFGRGLGLREGGREQQDEDGEKSSHTQSSFESQVSSFKQKHLATDGDGYSRS